MKPSTTICQELLDSVLGGAAPFLAWLEKQTHRNSSPVSLSLNDTQLALFLALFPLQPEKTVCLYNGSARQTQYLYEVIRAWQSALDVKNNWHLLPDVLTEQETSGLIVSSASQTHHRLLQPGGRGRFLIPAALADQHFPDPAAYAAARVTLHTGESRPQQDILRQLAAAGFVRGTGIPAPGGFRLQGEQLDIRPPIGPAVTLTWYGRHIETITSGQRPRRRQHKHLTLPPVVFPPAIIPAEQLLAGCRIIRPAQHDLVTARHTIIYNALHSDHAFPLQPVANPATAAPTAAPIIVTENAERVRSFCRQHGIAHPVLCTHPLARYAAALAANQRLIVTEAALLPPLTKNKPLPAAAGRALVAELTAGKPAVHADHGIGIFEGLALRTLEGQTREYLILRYAAGDTLSVPVEYAYKVTAYLGNAAPALHRLGSPVWRKAKARAAHDAERFARELLEIAARRHQGERPRFFVNPQVEAALADTFPFTLTSDQAASWQEVCQDLTGSHPMDRLIVGDVGFGKTELAIRAAKHVMENGRQVAVLAPTTLLVQQHADTFRTRLPADSSRIGQLSRFIPAADRAAVRAGLAAGQLGIVIGTHALLSPSIAWHNLGLVIIDEEQRFGVRHKEALKKLRARVDILSLSATPIPRTLSQALTGLKSLSVIATPPPGRQDVLTHVGRDSDAIITQALTGELARGGQAYVVAPHVQELGALARRITQLIPTARIAVAHGQLPDQQLAAAMQQFDTGQANILVSSSIIENGLDLPRANTLIVERATHFGLADLYQLRGRVGRRTQQGRAYFLYRQERLTDLQQQRLAALTEATRLGSGWSLAQRDLEIRGAGNLLGREQAGSVSSIGVQLYLDLVHDAAIRPTPGSVDRNEVDIQLPLPAAIPPHYVADAGTRTSYYQRLSRARTAAEIDQHIDRLAGIFGPSPEELKNLAAVLRLQHAAAQAGITAITAQRITPPQDLPYDKLSLTARNLPALLPTLASLGRWQVAGNEAHLTVPITSRPFVEKFTAALAAAA